MFVTTLRISSRIWMDLEYLRFGSGGVFSKILGFHAMRLNLTNIYNYIYMYYIYIRVWICYFINFQKNRRMLVTVVFVVMGWSQVKRMEPRRAFEFNHLFFDWKLAAFGVRTMWRCRGRNLRGYEKDLDRYICEDASRPKRMTDPWDERYIYHKSQPKVNQM